LKKSAVVRDVTMKKEVVNIDVSPEQLLQKEDLRIELF